MGMRVSSVPRMGRLQTRPRHEVPRLDAHSGGSGGPPRPKKPPTQEHGDDDNMPSRWPISWAFSLFGTAAWAMFTFPAPAHARDNDIDRYVENVMTTAGPILTTLGFSGFIGLCVGKALKAVSGCLAIAVGISFIGVQMFAHQTGKKMDYSALEDQGWFQKDEVSDALKTGLKMLTQGVPSVGGFLAGLALGLKW